MLNTVASNLGVKHAIPITEHEVVPPSDFKLTSESKNFNISMSTAFYYVTQDTLKQKVKTSETSFIISLYHTADSLLCTRAKSWS